MWELLKKLEDLGWKPYGKSIAELTETEKNVRLLTSRSSGLWQFCVENGMVKTDNSSIELNTMSEGYGVLTDKDYQYWLLESALRNEDELEEFLLDNIKVDE